MSQDKLARLAEATAAKERAEEALLRLPGVAGVGVRNQRIIIYTETVQAAETVPLEVDGIPISVRVTGGPIESFQVPVVNPLSLEAFAAARTAAWRPSLGGVSIGHPLITAGTFGAVVRDARDQSMVIISNTHVVSPHWRGAVEGDSVLQPGTFDGGTPVDRIGTVKRFQRVSVEPALNTVDGALAQPDNPDLVEAAILDVDAPLAGWTDAPIGVSCEKSGRTTGLTTSKVIDINATVKVNYGPDLGVATFRDQLIVDSPNKLFGGPGDSGSLIFTRAFGNPLAIGLLFAGAQNVIVGNKMGNVINALEIDPGPFIPPSEPPTVELLGAVAGPAIIGGVIVADELRKQGVPGF